MHHLIEAWQGKYASGGEVTLEDVFRHVRQKTVDDADQLFGQPQKPQVKREFKGEWVIARRTALAKQLELDLGGGIKMRLVRIEAGKFLMGSPVDEPGRPGPDDDWSEEQHEVEIARPFYMGVHEVTQAQYRQVMGKNPSAFSAGGFNKDKVAGLNTDEFPVDNVTWDDVNAFCARVSGLAAVKSRQLVVDLPTEAEWEYACRAGSKTAFHYGRAIDAKQANTSGANLNRPTKVAPYEPNAWGLYDMHGNVWEWCTDWFGGFYYKSGDLKDPQGPNTGKTRVNRGGSWLREVRACRSATRGGTEPEYRYADLGFRVVVRLPRAP
jgi:formylglycine-generating enzyme required for sulfatase activity